MPHNITLGKLTVRTVKPSEYVALRTVSSVNSKHMDSNIKECIRSASQSRAVKCFREGSCSQPSILEHFAKFDGQTKLMRGKIIGNTKRVHDGQLKDQIY